MTLNKLLVAAAASFILAGCVSTGPAVEKPMPVATDYLSVDVLIDGLVDGEPWNMVARDGLTANMVFNPDGTGALTGRMNISTSWSKDGEFLCIDLGMAGTRCVKGVSIEGGYDTFTDDQFAFSLTR